MIPSFGPNALTVLERRYLLREGGRVVETPAELLDRVARAVASATSRSGRAPGPFQQELATPLSRLEVLPNSPTLMDAGKPRGQLAACFVLPVTDDLTGIFD